MSFWYEVDKVWSWRGWATIKWAFAPFILWFVLYLIWQMNVNPSYSDEVLVYLKSLRLPNLHFDFSGLLKWGEAVR